ncbi:MAG: hypothetical protein KJZ72_12400 [Anaerolineales bacterium]|jgi:hypothetical protein|nr:hypothetical protein [Anaerolineales bacterium]
MNDLEQMITEEISTLDEMKLIYVLGFIRYLRAEQPSTGQWIEKWFENALQSIRAREDEFQLTPADIQAQIRQGRKAR